MENKDYLLVIGGSNIDIVGFSNAKIIPYDSNPGYIKFSPGGVGRNIVENIARLKGQVKFISVFGNDSFSLKMLKELDDLKVDTTSSLKLTEDLQSVCLSIQDHNHDLALGLSAMEHIELLNKDYLQQHQAIIKNAKYCVLEANLNPKTIDYLLNNFPQMQFIFDPVSITKLQKHQANIHRFTIIKPNLCEAEYLTKIKYKKQSDLKLMANKLLLSGNKEVYISLGVNGVYFANNHQHIYQPTKKVKVKNTLGAGDSFCGAIAYGKLKNYPEQKILILANKVAKITIQDEATVCKTLWAKINLRR